MTSNTSTALIADLRHRRHDMRRELARVRWWRRLIEARRELTLAQIAGAVESESLGMDAAWEALAAGAPTSRELARAIWPVQSAVSSQVLDALDELDARLRSYESRVSENLDTVTANMVNAMGDADASPRAERHG